MATKLTILFHVQTYRNGAPARLGGWSESFYLAEQPSVSALISKTNAFGAVRAPLLANNATIIGWRWQEVNVAVDNFTLVTGSSLAQSWTLSGSNATRTDNAKSAFRLKFRTRDQLSRRAVVIGGVPDYYCVGGEYQDVDAQYGPKLIAYAEFVKNNFMALCIDRAINQFRIIGFNDANANKLTTASAHGMSTGQYVHLHRCKDKWGRDVSGTFQVEVTTPTEFILRGGPFTEEAPIKYGQTARKVVMGFKQLDYEAVEIAQPKLVTKEIGAPFEKFVGR